MRLYMVHVISSASMYVIRAHEFLAILTCLFHIHASSMRGNSVKVGRDSATAVAAVRRDNTGGVDSG